MGQRFRSQCTDLVRKKNRIDGIKGGFFVYVFWGFYAFGPDLCWHRITREIERGTCSDWEEGITLII